MTRTILKHPNYFLPAFIFSFFKLKKFSGTFSGLFSARLYVVYRFFGFFFTVLHFGQVLGNVLSSFILTMAIQYVKPADGAEKS